MCRQLLQPDRALDGASHRTELDQHPITGGFDYPPAMLGAKRIGGGAMLAQGPRRASLVEPHQAAVACHISGKDRSETTFDGLLHGPPSARGIIAEH